MAVQELFPGTQVTIGPVIDDDFTMTLQEKHPFTEEDLNKIENKMKEIVDRDERQPGKFGLEKRQLSTLKILESFIKLK